MGALDAAASEYYNAETGLYVFESTGAQMTSEQKVEFWKEWVAK